MVLYLASQQWIHWCQLPSYKSLSTALVDSPEIVFKSGSCFHPIVLEIRIMALPNVQIHLSALVCATQDTSANFWNLPPENSLVGPRLCPPPSPPTAGERVVVAVPSTVSLLGQSVQRQQWQVNCPVLHSPRQRPWLALSSGVLTLHVWPLTALEAAD